MRNLQFRVNEQEKPLNVSLNEKIKLTWHNPEQTGFAVTILDETGHEVYQKKQTTDATKLTLRLPNHPQRKAYIAQLTVFNGPQTTKARVSFFSQNQELEQARWITRLDNPIEKEQLYFMDKPSIVLHRKIFVEEKVETAFIDICGLGYYTLKINGQKVGNAYLNSDVSHYGKRIYYDTYDITEYLNVGKNDFTVELANGWYNAAPLLILGKYNVRKQLTTGKPTMICDIHIKTASQTIRVCSDNQWSSGHGNLLQNNLYVGEVYCDDIQIKANVREQTVCIPGPTGKLQPSFIPKITRQDALKPVAITKQAEGWLVDFGQVVSGQIDVEVAADILGVLDLYYAEALDQSGALDFGSTISGRYGVRTAREEPNSPILQKDQLIKKRLEKLRYSNQYTYHSFRYVLVKSSTKAFPLQNIQAHRVFTELQVTANFESSSLWLNQLWQAGIATRQNNTHSYFEDCTRERFGYGGDIVALLHSQVATSDCKNLLKKVFLDFVDSQLPDGGITQTAPFVGIMTNGPSNQAGALGWQLVLPTLAISLVQNYGEDVFVLQHQVALERHLAYLLQFDFTYVRACCLGDWGAIDAKADNGVITSPDQAFCSGCMYVIVLETYLELIKGGLISGKNLALLQEKIALAKTILLEEYDVHTGDFASGSLSSDLFAIRSGLVTGAERESQIERLISKIRQQDSVFSLGIFGMSWAYELFATIGADELVFEWLNRKESPSYYAMLASGNGSLAEYFPLEGHQQEIPGSLNHAMFSSYGSWMLQSLVGLHWECDKLVIKPNLSLPLAWVKGSLETPFGQARLHWEKDSSSTTLTVEIPKKLVFREEVSASYPQSTTEITETTDYQKIVIQIGGTEDV